MKKHLLSFILMAMGAGMANAAEPVKGILCSYFGHEAFFPLSESPSVKYVDKSGEQNAVVLVGGAEKMSVALIDGGKLAVSYDSRALSEYTVNAKVTANGPSKTFDNQVVKAAEGQDGDVILTLPAAAFAGYEMAEQTVKVKFDAEGNITMVDGQTIDFTGMQDVVVTITSVAGTVAEGQLNLTMEGEGSNGIDVTFVYESCLDIALNSAGYATFSCKDNVNITGAEAYTASVEGETITLTKLEGYIPAGTGVILYNEDPSATVTTSVATSGEPADVTNNSLMPTTLANGSLAAMGTNVWALGDGNEFQRYTGAAFIHNRAYLVHEQSANARAMRVVFADGETTGLDNVESKTSAREGKYLENGNIVIIKNGKKYNVAGQTIK